MELIKEDERGKIYQAEDGFKVLYRKAGSISGDNDVNRKETIYFITGEMKITLKNKTWEVEAPIKIEFPEKTYHKIEAISDISFLLFSN